LARKFLAAKEAETAKRLKKVLLDWRESVDAQMMMPNPNYVPKK
jgi:hypothetical protein